MKLFRNPEFKRVFILSCAVSLAASVLAFLWDIRYGLYMSAVCAVFLLVIYISTRQRYKKIASLADDLNKILHGDMAVPIDKYSEGELAILASEIYKMTVRLREQQQSLNDDKVYLADSLADISHQIRTPLTSINLLVNFLSNPELTDERRKAVTGELYELLSRIEWLITALLKISKLDAGTVQFKSEHTPFCELINRSVAPLLVPMELREQTLDVKAEGEFCGDIAWTGEAIANIVKNCMEHTPNNGKVCISTADNALFSEIVISDNGVGIAAADLPHIFERFYKGANSDKGSFGIGLALSRMIINAQNGTVKAENNPDCGAKFTVRFYKGTV